MAPLAPLLVVALAASALASAPPASGPALPAAIESVIGAVTHLFGTGPDIGLVAPRVYDGENGRSAPAAPGVSSGTPPSLNDNNRVPPAAKKAPAQQVAGILAGAANVRSLGAALAPSFARQWHNVLAFTRRDYSAFEQKVKQSSPAKRAVADLIAKLHEAADEQEVKVLAWVKQQGRDTVALAAKYTDLVDERLKASAQQAADDSAINVLRKELLDLVLKWQVGLLDLVNERRTAFMQIVRQAAGAAGSAKQAVKNVGKRLVWRIIDEQVRFVDLLTSTQGPQLSSFTVQASKVFFQIAVAAQADSL